MPFTLNVHSKLLADDTTLYKSFDLKNNSFDEVLKEFKNDLSHFISPKNNRLYVNWLRTFLMVISPKNKIRLPKFIEIDDYKVTFVTDLKLLGITIDDRLNFRKHILNIIEKVNSKLKLKNSKSLIPKLKYKHLSFLYFSNFLVFSQIK